MGTSLNRRWFNVASAPGSGDVACGSALAGFLGLGAAQDGMTFNGVTFLDGSAWEERNGCVYTHSTTTLTRGTLEESSAGPTTPISLSASTTVMLSVSADAIRRYESAALAHVAGANAATSMEVGNLYVIDGATLTANRTYTLPATAAVGDRVGVMMSAGSASYEVLLTAASGDTLNGVAGGTEWSRIFQVGEVIIMRCVSASAAWVVEQDGRIPQVGRMGLTSDITSSSAGAWNATDFTEAQVAQGCIVNVSGAGTSTIKVRRNGVYTISGSLTAKSGAVVVDQESFGWACTANGNVGVGTVLCAFSASRTSGTAQQGASGVIAAPCAAGDLLQHSFYWQTTANAGLRGLNYASFMAVSEVL